MTYSDLYVYVGGVCTQYTCLRVIKEASDHKSSNAEDELDINVYSCIGNGAHVPATFFAKIATHLP